MAWQLLLSATAMANTSIAGSLSEVLLVAEHGTAWARWMDELADAGAPFNAIMQSPNESLKAFARRVSTRVSTMSLEHRLAPTVLFVTGAERAEEAASPVRQSIIDKLARYGVRVLVARDGASAVATAA
jgi:hypothetical protein